MLYAVWLTISVFKRPFRGKYKFSRSYGKIIINRTIFQQNRKHFASPKYYAWIEQRDFDSINRKPQFYVMFGAVRRHSSANFLGTMNNFCVRYQPNNTKAHGY